MQLTFFSRTGWQDWDVAAEPAFPDRMPQLVDDDLLFEDAGVPRPGVAVNRWLRELPVSGAAAPGTWAKYARALRDWMTFLPPLGIGVFGTRDELKRALGAYAAHRAGGPVQARWAASTWNQNICVLSVFYQWAVAEGHAGAVPFTYAQAMSRYGNQVRLVQANLARRRVPKPHVTIKYLEADFAALFLGALAGLGPDGTADAGYRGRELARNSAAGRLALATGLRRREFTFLLVSRCRRHRRLGIRQAFRCCSACRRRWPRAASTGPPGSTRTRCARCTAISAWTGRRVPPGQRGHRRRAWASRCWSPVPALTGAGSTAAG